MIPIARRYHATGAAHFADIGENGIKLTMWITCKGHERHQRHRGPFSI